MDRLIFTSVVMSCFFYQGKFIFKVVGVFSSRGGDFFIAAALLRSAREDRGFGCM